MAWFFAGPLLAGLAGLALGKWRQQPIWRAVFSGAGLFFCIWSTNVFPQFPPKVQMDWIAWAALLPTFSSKAGKIALALLVGWGMLPHPDWAFFAMVLAAAYGEETDLSWKSRLSTVGVSLLAGGALYTGSSARMAIAAVGWGIASGIAGGGSSLPLALLLLAGHAFAFLPDLLLVGTLVLAMVGLRQPVGWMAAAAVAANLQLSDAS